MRPFEISVVVPVRNEGDRLVRMVRSVIEGRSCAFPIEIVLVDDASTDGCCDAMGDALSIYGDTVGVKALRLQSWSGIPYARNVGGLAAQAPILFHTDANVRFPQNWDIPVRREFRPGRVLCAAIADMASDFKGYGCELEFPSMGVKWLRNPSALAGAAPVSPCTGTVVGSSEFAAIGGYDVRMPVYGAAEPEFSIRAWLKGYVIQVLDDLVLTHRFRPAAERAPFLRRIEPLQVHNYLRFALLYLGKYHLTQVVEYYSAMSPLYFKRAFDAATANGIWKYRERLEKSRRSHFEAFSRRFGLRDRSGRIVV